MINRINTNTIPFRGMHKTKVESYNKENIDFLNHTTDFFRYNFSNSDLTDEFLIDYLSDLQTKKPISIVSAGCSYGEEPYSYAIGLQHLEPKVQISAFDVSKKVIECAKKGVYVLDEYEKKYFSEPDDTYDDFKKEIIANFKENFECIDEENQKYKLKDGCLNNCNFFQADIRDISKHYKANSQDLILCRNVLYHLENVAFDAPDEFQDVFEQLYDIVKPNGLVCLDSYEYDIYDEYMKKEGFIQPFEERPWIYKKPNRPSARLISFFRNKLH